MTIICYYRRERGRERERGERWRERERERERDIYNRLRVQWGRLEATNIL